MYINSILTAFLCFPLIALFFTLPYMLFQYRKYGAIPRFRTFIIYSFILYLMCAYFLVILPLPKLEEVKNLITPRYQLIPFNTINDIKNASLNITGLKSILTLIKEPVINQILYNILLFIPFGIYLKYYFKCNLKKTILISFLVSLFFELTQLSGLYFIYERGYRLFDVDDLITNTLGGLIGYYLSNVFKFLPKRDKIDDNAYQKGMHIPLFRRLYAFIIDAIICTFLNVILTILTMDMLHNTTYNALAIIIYYILIPYFTNGYTLGKRMLKIRIISTDNQKLTFSQLIVRNGILYFIIIKGFSFICGILSKYSISIIKSKNEGVYFLMSLIMFIVITYIFKRINDISNERLLLYEKLSKTKNNSTIKIGE